MEEVFLTDMPNLESFIKELDMFNDNVNTALRKGLHEAGDMICQAQKRLIESKPVSTAEGKYKKYQRKSKLRLKRLSDFITTGKIYTNKEGALAITSGYQAEAFTNDADGFNAGTVGMVTEFGRPGKTTAHHRNSPKMKQVRKRIPNKKSAKRKDWLKAEPTEVEIDKGTIQPYSHIRRGFDSTKEQAAQKLIDAYNAEIAKLGDK